MTSTIVEVRNEVVRRPGLGGPGRRTLMTEVTDAWLSDLFDAALRTVPVRACLVAVGSHGRRELAPGSDLDLVLLHYGNDEQAQALAAALWYPIWDSGLRLDHSVRTVAEARTLAAHDVKVMLGLLDARVIAGDPRLGDHLRETVLVDWRAMARRRFADIHDLVERRRAQFGDISQMLEPDLKEAYGGLREANILRGLMASWAVDIPQSGWQASAIFLSDVRDALHLVTGSRSDVLRLQDHQDIAEYVGCDDGDTLLRAVYAAGRTLAYTSDIAWYRVHRLTRESAVHRSTRGATRYPLAEGVVLQDGEVVLAHDARPVTDPELTLRAAAVAAQTGWPLAPYTLDRLSDVHLPQPWSREARAAWIRLLGSGEPLRHVWESLDQAGILERLLPEWSSVRSTPQHNPMHRFTVDRHLIETTIEAAQLTRSVDRPDLLLMGALLHDIGKGKPGDHSVVGAEIAADICVRMGFTSAECETIVALVRYHLLLPDIATKRDIDDPRTIEELCTVLSDPEFVELLGALSLADARATGPAVSSEWRLSLIATLTRRVAEHLRGTTPAMTPQLRAEELLAVQQSGVWVLIEDADMGCTVSVAAPDSPGLLATIAAVLALHRLQIYQARVQTIGQRALQTWQVTPLFGDPPETALLAEEIRRALDGRSDPGAVLRARAQEAEPPRRTAFPEPWVRVDSSGTPSVVEVRAHDRPGLLHAVAQAISSVGVDISGAKVDTLGSDVVDVFFVTDAGGRALSPEQAASVRERILAVLGQRLP
jgi:[protein-PII] uridylyltransferase